MVPEAKEYNALDRLQFVRAGANLRSIRVVRQQILTYFGLFIFTSTGLLSMHQCDLRDLGADPDLVVVSLLGQGITDEKTRALSIV